MRRQIGLALALLLLIPAVATAQSQLPNTPVRPVTEDYFGTKVVDPYRWLENTSDPEVVAWMKAQNDYTRAVLARIPGRDELLARIKSLDNAGDTVSGLQVWGGHYFYYKTAPGSDNRKLFVRDTLSSPERLLVDTEKMTTADGKHYSIDYYQPSLDGVYVGLWNFAGRLRRQCAARLAERHRHSVCRIALIAPSLVPPPGCPTANLFSIRGRKNSQPTRPPPRNIRS